MWLPKDERRLLAGYYALIRAVDTEKAYHLSDLAPLLRFRGHRWPVPEYGESEGSTDNSGDLESIKREIDADIDARVQITKANSLLTARGLITRTPQQHEIDVVGFHLCARLRLDNTRKHQLEVVRNDMGEFPPFQYLFQMTVRCHSFKSSLMIFLGPPSRLVLQSFMGMMTSMRSGQPNSFSRS